MIAVPWSLPVTTPAALMTATAGFELCQVTSDAGEVTPEAVVTLAVASTDVPERTGPETLIDNVDVDVAVAVNVTDPAPGARRRGPARTDAPSTSHAVDALAATD